MTTTRRDFLKITGTSAIVLATNPFSLVESKNPIYLPRTQPITSLLDTIQSNPRSPKKIFLDSDDLIGIATLTGDLSFVDQDLQGRTYALGGKLIVERYGLQGRFELESISGDITTINYHTQSAAD